MLKEVPPEFRRVVEGVCRRCMVKCAFNDANGYLHFYRHDPMFGVWQESVVRPDGSRRKLDSANEDEICRCIHRANEPWKFKKRRLDDSARAAAHEREQVAGRVAEESTKAGIDKARILRGAKKSLVVDGLKGGA